MINLITGSYALLFRVLVITTVILTFLAIKKSESELKPKCPNVNLDQMSEMCFIEKFTAQRQVRARIFSRVVPDDFWVLFENKRNFEVL